MIAPFGTRYHRALLKDGQAVLYPLTNPCLLQTGSPRRGEEEQKTVII